MKLLKNLFQNKNDVTAKKKNAVQTKPPQKDKEKVAARKGELGEYKIDIQLDQLPKDHKHLNDLQVSNPKAKSGYSQIDHVVISPFGIFVIETKNYQGTVYGGKDRKTWSVNGKFKMMNPFVQNYGHIQALKNCIDEKYHHLFISMVSFTKRCTFKIDELDLRKIASDQLLVYDTELFEYIYRKVSVLKVQHKDPLLNETEIKNIYESIQSANIIDLKIREEHVQNLKAEKNVQATCSTCQKPVSEKVKSFCLNNKKFDGKIYCFEHQKSL